MFIKKILRYVSSLHPFLFENFINAVHVCFCVLVVSTFLNIPVSSGKDSKIFSHLSLFNGFNDRLLEKFTEAVEFSVSVNLCSVHKTSSPCKDTSNWVGGSALSFLILSPMSGDSSMSSLRFEAAILID